MPGPVCYARDRAKAFFLNGSVMRSLKSLAVFVTGAAFSLAALSLAACRQGGPAAAPEQPAPQDVEAARAAAGELGAALVAALSEAMAARGVDGALAVCNEAAPEIAAKLSATRGMEIGRTALRVRNSANAPDEWERAQLEAFAARHEAGEAFAAMDVSQMVEENGASVFRWMKPIPMGAPCAACHGENVDPATLAAVRALYPEDQATGFAPGSLRGAFTVKKTLAASPSR